MASGKMDRRSARTRGALQAAFVELLLSRGYAAVRVGDIVHRADVGRSTFYGHYAGKAALLEETFERPCSALAGCVGGEVTPRTLTPLLEHFRAQRTVNRVLFEYPLRRLWVKTLAASIERNVARLAGAAGSAQRPPRIPRALFAAMLAEMQIALITHWLAGAASLKPELIAQALLDHTRALLAGRAPGC